MPADGFYEWKKLDPKTKQPYAYTLSNGQPFAFAGLRDAWKDPATGQWLQSFAVITTTPNELTAEVHNRMPVILAPKDYARWLDRGQAERLPGDLLRPYPAEEMKAALAIPRWATSATTAPKRMNNDGSVPPRARPPTRRWPRWKSFLTAANGAWTGVVFVIGIFGLPYFLPAVKLEAGLPLNPDPYSAPFTVLNDAHLALGLSELDCRTMMAEREGDIIVSGVETTTRLASPVLLSGGGSTTIFCESSVRVGNARTKSADVVLSAAYQPYSFSLVHFKEA